MSPDPVLIRISTFPELREQADPINKAFSAFAAARSHSGLAPWTVQNYRHEVRYFVR